MNRSLKLSMLMALALGGSQTMAMELGQIQVKSALGQPLLAEIPVRPESLEELQSLRVGLASSEEFARAGIVGGRTTIPLRFSLVKAEAGPSIRISSTEVVDDPFLDLLLEVHVGTDKSVREFTILLDPPKTPVVAGNPPSASQPAPRPAAPAPAPAPAAAPSPASPAAPVAEGGEYGPVEHGQTLSGIAHRVAPAGVNAQQMMLALQKANPDAFYRDNINALKSGAVLRVPTAAEAQAVTLAAAAAEVRRQNGDWSAGTPGQPAVVADAATAAPSSTADTATKTDGDRLALVPAKSESGKEASAGGGNAQDLMRAQESLASLRQQSAELQDRLKDLSDINDKNERLLALKDNEIAELQAKLAEARKAAGMPAEVETAAPETEPTGMPAAAASAGEAEESPMSADADLGVAAASTSGHSDEAPVAAGSAAEPAEAASAPVLADTPAATPAEPAKPAAKPATKPAPAPAAVEPWYMQTWAWAAGGGVVVLLLLLALLGRRRKPVAKTVASSSLADRFSEDSMSQDAAAGTDTDQEELLDQLAEHPDDVGLHLELVTLYYSRRDVEHFEAAAEAMHAHITDSQQDEWQDVLHMGEDLSPGHPLFATHADLPASEEAEARSAFDIDDYADAADASAMDAPPPLPSSSPKKVSEYSFNFDLTRQPASEPAPPPPAAEDDDITVVAPLVSPPEDDAVGEVTAEPVSSWQFDEPESDYQIADQADDQDQGLGEFSDDPVDTKLDLARAYLDMGDTDGARAMLDEVIKEGSQMQQDVARGLLEKLG